MNGIAVFFPGIGYHCDKPLLYFSRELAREAGYREIVNVNYAYRGGDIRGTPEKMRAAGLALFAQTEDALKKSNGTLTTIFCSSPRAWGLRLPPHTRGFTA